MNVELSNKWEKIAAEYADKVINMNRKSLDLLTSPSIATNVIYAAFLAGALKATEECSRIMKK